MTTWCEAWPPTLGSGLLSWVWSLSGFSSTLYCHQLCPFAGAPKFWWWLSLDQAGSRTWVRQVSWSLFPIVTLRGFSSPYAGLGVICLFWGEASVTHICSIRALFLPFLLPTVPQDLMDVSMSNLPSLWQPSTHKSSCASCSQSGSGDGVSTNGCKHERYEGLELWMEGIGRIYQRFRVTCLALTSEALESSRFKLNPHLAKS